MSRRGWITRKSIRQFGCSAVRGFGRSTVPRLSSPHLLSLLPTGRCPLPAAFQPLPPTSWQLTHFTNPPVSSCLLPAAPCQLPAILLRRSSSVPRCLSARVPLRSPAPALLLPDPRPRSPDPRSSQLTTPPIHRSTARHLLSFPSCPVAGSPNCLAPKCPGAWLPKFQGAQMP